MQLKLDRPIVFFDLETTGVDIVNDRIVEICLLKVFPNGNQESKVMRINPTIHIPEEASAVHGIYDADVADCPTFKEVAEEVYAFIRGCDLGGFNSNHFDIPMLVEEFLRNGINIDLRNTRCVDVQNIYHKLERRTLIAAYKFYCHKDLENAHSALADTEATYEVLCAQLDHYPEELQNDIDFLTEYSRRNRNVDFAGRIVYDDKNVEVFNFGKYKGMPVAEVLRRDPGYYSWIQQGDFALNTKQVLTEIALRSRSTK
ncbi:MAG: 3'-5' exonuclease [Bacteroidaceae bacterium]|nr:3'-5' exonuclease [Bacteroidaceae bacterium]MBR1665121.1 3'-5' exonuclease [Bacteroidaceae bacterium]